MEEAGWRSRSVEPERRLGPQCPRKKLGGCDLCRSVNMGSFLNSPLNWKMLFNDSQSLPLNTQAMPNRKDRPRTRADRGHPAKSDSQCDAGDAGVHDPGPPGRARTPASGISRLALYS